MTAHVFISYSKQDADFAAHLCRLFDREGIPYWIDRRLEAGDAWWPAIERSITACAAFVIIMSPHSQGSTWVEREILLAENLKKPIFPILLAGTPFTRLTNVQYEDMQAGVKAKLTQNFRNRLIRLTSATSSTPLPAPADRNTTRPPIPWLAVLGLVLAFLVFLIGDNVVGRFLETTNVSTPTPTATASSTSTLTSSPTSDPSATFTLTLTVSPAVTLTSDLTPSSIPPTTSVPLPPIATFTSEGTVPTSEIVSLAKLAPWSEVNGLRRNTTLEGIAYNHAEKLAQMTFQELAEYDLCLSETEATFERRANASTYRGDVFAVVVAVPRDITFDDLTTRLPVMDRFKDVGFHLATDFGATHSYLVVLLGTGAETSAPPSECVALYE